MQSVAARARRDVRGEVRAVPSIFNTSKRFEGCGLVRLAFILSATGASLGAFAKLDALAALARGSLLLLLRRLLQISVTLEAHRELLVEGRDRVQSEAIRRGNQETEDIRDTHLLAAVRHRPIMCIVREQLERGELTSRGELEGRAAGLAMGGVRDRREHREQMGRSSDRPT
jgi:hypothetical protein